jgi:hypothetical protein
MNLYRLLTSTGHIPDNCIDKDIIDIYVHPDYGLCLGFYGLLIATRFQMTLDAEEVTLQRLSQASNVDDLARLELFGAVSIDQLMPIKTMTLTADLLFLSPNEILEAVLELIKIGRRKNIDILGGAKNDN